jgi:hypothetical protein
MATRAVAANSARMAPLFWLLVVPAVLLAPLAGEVLVAVPAVVPVLLPPDEPPLPTLTPAASHASVKAVVS